MNVQWRISTRSRGLSGIIMAMGILCLAGAPVAVAQDYIGPEGCLEACHSDGPHEQAFRDWSASGHPYKLAKAEDAMKRPILLPDGLLWEDISYVIGGFKWKSRYMDTDGYIITADAFGPGNNQWNYLAGEWSDYHAGEVMLPYTCGSCHTTGWVADTDADTDGTLTDNQDGLPGIHGTFFAGGVQCEACHGASATGPTGSSDHGALADIRGAEMCGNCHIRGAADTIPASGGFIRHHEQYNEFLASPHRNMSCVTCHDPHKRSEWSIKEGFTCQDCHTTETAAYATTTMFASGVECKDCHMPYATKSGLALGTHKGDLQTHLFRINTDPAFEMFTPDGGFVNLMEIDGAANQGMVGLDFVCLRCHEAQSMDWAASYAEGFHNTAFRITAGITGTWWGGPGRDGEGWLIDNANAFVAAFYTYNNVGDSAWVIGLPIGPDQQINGNVVTVTLEIQDPMGQGPSWGDAYNAANKNTVPFGTATFTFTDCFNGSVTIVPNAEMMAAGYSTVTIPITRSTSPQISCPGTG